MNGKFQSPQTAAYGTEGRVADMDKITDTGFSAHQVEEASRAFLAQRIAGESLSASILAALVTARDVEKEDRQ